MGIPPVYSPTNLSSKKKKTSPCTHPIEPTGFIQEWKLSCLAELLLACNLELWSMNLFISWWFTSNHVWTKLKVKNETLSCLPHKRSTVQISLNKQRRNRNKRSWYGSTVKSPNCQSGWKIIMAHFGVKITDQFWQKREIVWGLKFSRKCWWRFVFLVMTPYQLLNFRQ